MDPLRRARECGTVGSSTGGSFRTGRGVCRIAVRPRIRVQAGKLRLPAAVHRGPLDGLRSESKTLPSRLRLVASAVRRMLRRRGRWLYGGLLGRLRVVLLGTANSRCAEPLPRLRGCLWRWPGVRVHGSSAGALVGRPWDLALVSPYLKLLSYEDYSSGACMAGAARTLGRSAKDRAC